MVKIEIPYLPPRELRPNTWCNPMARYRVSQQLKTDVYYLAILQRMEAWSPILNPVVNVTFVVKQKRRRDRDNAIASLKSAADGLEAAGVFFNDEQVRWGSVEWVVNKMEAPKTILEVTDAT